MPMRTGAELLIDALTQHGVGRVFGIPGVHTMAVYEALRTRQCNLQHVLTRHESGAGFMADGYARASGGVGVALSITGPGVTNMTTALGVAFADSSPLLLISSQNHSERMDRDVGSLHQLKDQLGVTAGCTAYSQRVEQVDAIPDLINDAFYYLQRQRPRPIHIEIPRDVLEQSTTQTDQGPIAVDDWLPDQHQLREIREHLWHAERPMLVVGGGAAEAADWIRELAHQLQAPVVTTVAGKGVLSAEDPLCLGCALESEIVQQYLLASDAVLVLASELSAQEMHEGSMRFSGPWAWIDREPIPGRLGYYPTWTVRSDVGRFVRYLVEGFRPVAPQDRKQAYRESVAALRDSCKLTATDEQSKMDVWIKAIRSALPREGIWIGDMTTISYRAHRAFPVFNPRSYLFPQGFGPLGWSLPAAFGATMACPERPVVSVIGDGGMLFSVQELATAVKYQLPVPIVLFNNESYGIVASLQRERYGHAFGTDILNPDFVALGRAFGAHAERIREPEALAEQLSLAWRADRPTLIEVPVDF